MGGNIRWRMVVDVYLGLGEVEEGDKTGKR